MTTPIPARSPFQCDPRDAGGEHRKGAAREAQHRRRAYPLAVAA